MSEVSTQVSKTPCRLRESGDSACRLRVRRLNDLSRACILLARLVWFNLWGRLDSASGRTRAKSPNLPPPRSLWGVGEGGLVA